MITFLIIWVACSIITYCTACLKWGKPECPWLNAAACLIIWPLFLYGIITE